jgi:hypothetical protein
MIWYYRQILIYVNMKTECIGVWENRSNGDMMKGGNGEGEKEHAALKIRLWLETQYFVPGETMLRIWIFEI